MKVNLPLEVLDRSVDDTSMHLDRKVLAAATE